MQCPYVRTDGRRCKENFRLRQDLREHCLIEHFRVLGAGTSDKFENVSTTELRNRRDDLLQQRGLITPLPKGVSLEHGGRSIGRGQGRASERTNRMPDQEGSRVIIKTASIGRDLSVTGRRGESDQQAAAAVVPWSRKQQVTGGEQKTLTADAVVERGSGFEATVMRCEPATHLFGPLHAAVLLRHRQMLSGSGPSNLRTSTCRSSRPRYRRLKTSRPSRKQNRKVGQKPVTSLQQQQQQH